MPYQLDKFIMEDEVLEITDAYARDKIDNMPEVAFTGDYDDLTNKPDLSIYAQSDDLAAVATSGDYDDLINKPALATVATSGSYTDLTNKPTIPTVNNATLTIQKNGTTVNTFTANASSDVTCNITVPTDNADLTNNAGFITRSTSVSGKWGRNNIGGMLIVTCTTDAVSCNFSNAFGSSYYVDKTISIPSGVRMTTMAGVSVQALADLGCVTVHLLSYSNSQIRVRLMNPVSATANIAFSIICVGV